MYVYIYGSFYKAKCFFFIKVYIDLCKPNHYSSTSFFSFSRVFNLSVLINNKYSLKKVAKIYFNFEVWDVVTYEKNSTFKYFFANFILYILSNIIAFLR